MQIQSRNVLEIDITTFRSCIVIKHRVDGFGEFRATLLVDAAGIYPYLSVSVLFCLHTTIPDLGGYHVPRILASSVAPFNYCIDIAVVLLICAPRV